ncbi:MAG: ABC transporter permease [Flavobacteriales bacterium]|nr:ABC transporter permease [Flavobacteriales bacterium]|tara:strand:+ start:449 stop:1729 length:1281 start_codon:yes stop_codon:yes gene_type:complete
MNKLFLIIKREYLSRLRKKSFIIMTLLTPLFMIGVFVVPILLASTSEDKTTIAIIDNNKFNEFRLTSNLNLEYTYLNELNLEQHKTTLIETYDFLLHIPEIDSIQQIESSIEIYSINQMSLSTKQNIENQIDKKLTNMYLLQSGINPDQIKKSQSKSRIKTYVVDEQGENTKGNSEASFGIGLVGGFLIYIFIFMYGTMVMRSVIEEKTNRIVEIIISSVKPFELMLGKIISVALVGLSQFAMWIILGFVFLLIANGFIPLDIDVTNLNTNEAVLSSEIGSSLIALPIKSLIFVFLVYFLGGYLLYGSLFAAIGSASDQETDSQQFIIPITMPLIVSFVLVQVVIDNPHGALAYWLSMIPFTSPIIMIARIPFGVPIHELLLSISLLIGGFLLTTWLAAKIYRVGILMYGKKISYKELLKWLKYKD